VRAVTYFVKNGGNDSASGKSNAQAWATVAKVNRFAFADGDTICFARDSVFNDETLRDIAANHITIRDYGLGAKPVLDGNAHQPVRIYPNREISNLAIINIDIRGQAWAQTKGSNLYIRNVSGLLLDGIEGHNRPQPRVHGKTAITVSSCRGTIIIRNCALTHWGENLLTGKSPDFMGIVIRDMHDGSYEITHNTVGRIQADAIHVYNTTASGTIHHNTLYNAGEDGIDFKSSQHGEFSYNQFYRTSDFTGEGGTGSGGIPTHIVIHSPGRYNAEEVRIHHNRFKNGDSAGIKMAGASRIVIEHNRFHTVPSSVFIGDKVAEVDIHHNVIINPMSRLMRTGLDAGGIYENNSMAGVRIFNNTIYNASGTCRDLIAVACSGGTQIFHNIAVQGENKDATHVLNYHKCGQAPVIHHNCWYHADGPTRIKYRGTVYTEKQDKEWRLFNSGDMFTDPQLEFDATNDSLALQPTTPCRGDEMWGAGAP
jgi:hypothetical protein